MLGNTFYYAFPYGNGGFVSLITTQFFNVIIASLKILGLHKFLLCRKKKKDSWQNWCSPCFAFRSCFSVFPGGNPMWDTWHAAPVTFILQNTAISSTAAQQHHRSNEKNTCRLSVTAITSHMLRLGKGHRHGKKQTKSDCCYKTWYIQLSPMSKKHIIFYTPESTQISCMQHYDAL